MFHCFVSSPRGIDSDLRRKAKKARILEASRVPGDA